MRARVWALAVALACLAAGEAARPARADTGAETATLAA